MRKKCGGDRNDEIGDLRPEIGPIQLKNRLGSLADKILDYEWVVLMLVAYPMLFPKPEWTPVMLVIPLLWFLHWKRGNGVVPSTPLNLPILLLMIMLGVSLWATFSIEFSLPKISSLVFAMGVFFATVSYRVRDIQKALLFFFGFGIALGGIGILATNWSAKLPFLDRIMSQLPQVITTLPAAEQGIHPNELGGLLILFVPVAVTLGWKALVIRPRTNRTLIFVTISSAIGLGILVILTQSRSALLGLIAAVGVLFFSGGKLGRILFGVGILVAATLILWKGPDLLFGSSDPLESSSIVVGELSFASRLEIWSRAIYALNDFSITGMGIGTFRKIAPILYPFFILSPSLEIGHAHNFLLQTGLDLGILGLISTFAIWAVGGLMLLEVVKTKRQHKILEGFSLGDLAIGISASLIAHFIYGFTDAVALGARPGFILWMAMGLAAGIYILSVESIEKDDPGLVAWGLGSRGSLGAEVKGSLGAGELGCRGAREQEKKLSAISYQQKN
ncbi:MAG: O-antigen ligase family protein [Chloroflexi bacterium]|nr:O-antigen ligase family protein [Chloroflexota bacterium]